MKTCAYSNCNKPVNELQNSKFCIFHAKREDKGISIGEFNARIDDQKGRNDFDFQGYIFPGDIKFVNFRFVQEANFKDATFCGEANFDETEFLQDAWFTSTQFVGDVRFVKACFKEAVSFNSTQFLKNAFFVRTIFLGETYFNAAIFGSENTKIQFHRAQFHKKAHFIGATFQGLAYFTNAKFLEESNFELSKFQQRIEFKEAKFSNKVSFDFTTFSGSADFPQCIFSKYAYFRDVKFLDFVNFNDSQFHDDALFENTRFEGKLFVTSTEFSKRVYFKNNKILSQFHFNETRFNVGSTFRFESPTFVLPTNEQEKCLIIFERIQFNPFSVYFDNISLPALSDCPQSHSFRIGTIFRYCQLKDVYFSKCDLSNTSFFKSSFDEARFISCNWGIKSKIVFKIPFKKFSYLRKNIIFEESLFEERKNLFSQHDKEVFSEIFKIEDLEKYDHIANLYSRMKTALDRTKNYQEAGGLFFNQLEMQRLHATTWGRKTAYFLYKFLAGYGEKPLWSFVWFLILSFLFSVLYLISGLKVDGKTLKYTFSPDWEALKFYSTWQFWHDFFTALSYNLYRIIPVSYFPLSTTSITSIGLDGLILSLTNTFVMLLMISFIIVGLKRRFRRF